MTKYPNTQGSTNAELPPLWGEVDSPSGGCILPKSCRRPYLALPPLHTSTVPTPFLKLGPFHLIATKRSSGKVHLTAV